MQLVQRSLRSRSFLLQFQEIMSEFGNQIPWLEPLRSLNYVTNIDHFRSELLKRLNCDEEEIVPYQLITSDVPREFVGGAIYFPQCPERLTDRVNRRIMERLEQGRYRFFTCLQVRSDLRGQGHGSEHTKRCLQSVFAAMHPRVWGVVSQPRLLPWYGSLGGTVLSPLDNSDKLWIVAFDKMAHSTKG